MTYTHKLARRLALSRDFAMLTALVLLAACAGETTAPEAAEPNTPSAPTAPHGFRVLPGSVTIEVDQRIRFRGEFKSPRGAVRTPPMDWKAIGGTIKPNGTFSASKPGTYRVIGRSRAGDRAWLQRPDTSVVVVVAKQPKVVDIRVTPRTPELYGGQKRTFTAAGKLPDGTSTAIRVSWSATGGTIDQAGVYRAESVPGTYSVIATTTNGKLADTVPVTILPDLPETPTEPATVAVKLVLRPATVFLATSSTHTFATFGRTSAGDSVAVDVTFRATGGTITPTGLYTAGQTAGTYRVIATSDQLADTAVVSLASTAGGDTPTPAPSPAPGGVGVPVGLSGLLNSGRDPLYYTASLDGYTASNILPRIDEARRKKIRLLMNLTGGAHDNYKTDGVFDQAKWRAKMETYNTAAIRAAVAAAVADGTIIGASVMDEPHQSDANLNYPDKSWGPEGWMTKVKVDALCGYVKGIFPTLPTGVNHDHRHFEPEKNYAVCDFLGSQYRASKGSVVTWRDGALAFARRSGVQVVLGINLLHGGAKRSDCAAPCDMTPTEIREFGLALGPHACALNMWRYERAYFDRPDVQSAVRFVADSLGKLSRVACTRP